MSSYLQLEYPRVLELIAALTHSSVARKQVLALTPFTNINTITARLALADELRAWLRHNSRPQLHGCGPAQQVFKTYHHTQFGYEEFAAVCLSIQAANRLTKLEPEQLLDYPLLQGKVNQLIPLDYLEKRWLQIFGAEGEILDSASSELARIRRSQGQMRTRIVGTLQKNLSTKWSTLAQDQLVSQRDDRYVIPAKDGAQAHLGGIVHARSGSGATSWLEPAEVVPLNNELANLKDEEHAEIQRLLTEFTQQLRDANPTICQNEQIALELDFFLAVAEYAFKLDARAPRIVAEPYLELKQARHPLLIESLGLAKVVPFDLELGKDYRLLIISGPNTGGKTVTLKSVGLLSMMALSGLPIPADSASIIGLFTGFFADIGDQQSIEGAQSTFSSHIARLKLMSDKADEYSLALIDEIGSATDPEQGAALAQALVEELASRGVAGVITTHYTPLKVFAEQHAACRNAAMQFDKDEHRPTYSFRLGLPGHSFAIETAKRLGLDEHLVARATQLAGRQNIELTELINKMAEEKKALARNNYQFELKTRLLEQKISEYEQKLKQQEQDLKDIRKKAVKEAREIVSGVQAQLNRELDDLKKADKQERRTLVKQKTGATVALGQQLEQELQTLVDTPGGNVTNPTPGLTVWVKDFDSKGIIVEVKGNNVKVDINGFYYTTSLKKLNSVQQQPKPVKPQVSAPAKASAKLEINILGRTFDEAQPLLEEFLDEACAAGLGKVRIVHGKGTGALRKKVRNWLRKVPHVTEFYGPAPEAGGDGVTVVSFN